MKSTDDILNDFLEDIIEERKKPKVKNQINLFAKKFNIEVGEDKIPNYLIYYMYKTKWKSYPNTHKLSKIEFFRQFSKLFQSYRIGRQRYYLLNKDAFDLTKPSLMDAEFYDKKYQRRKKEDNKKKPSKVSKPGQGLQPKGS